MAAFCAYCGADITLKAEACPACGAPRHGMAQPDRVRTLDDRVEVPQEDIKHRFNGCVRRG